MGEHQVLKRKEKKNYTVFMAGCETVPNQGVHSWGLPVIQSQGLLKRGGPPLIPGTSLAINLRGETGNLGGTTWEKDCAMEKRGIGKRQKHGDIYPCSLGGGRITTSAHDIRKGENLRVSQKKADFRKSVIEG